jgi:ACS family glucarate transporter-like MFS transporter
MAAPSIQKDLGLTPIQMGWAFSVFGWAYALFEVPGGWLADRMGPRRVLMRIVIWWSFFTAATGWAWNFWSLIIMRTLFGAGEAGAFPNMTRVFTTWLPGRERERAQATLWLASRWGGALTPLLVAYILQFISWRRAFELFGVLGVVWAIAFYKWFRDDPAEHPGVNSAELALLPPARETAAVSGPLPWRLLLSKPAVWLLCAQYACLAYGWWFYVTWLPTYLRNARGTSIKMSALLAGLPLLMGGVGCLISAALIPRIARSLGSVARARRIVAIIGFLGASASILVFTRVQDPMLAMFILGFAGLFNDFVMPAAWAGCMDVGGRYAGTVAGSMNMFGSIAGALSPLVVGYLLAWTNQDWTLTFYVSAAIYSLGAVCWIFLDAHTPMEGTEAGRS